MTDFCLSSGIILQNKITLNHGVVALSLLLWLLALSLKGAIWVFLIVPEHVAPIAWGTITNVHIVDIHDFESIVFFFLIQRRKKNSEQVLDRQIRVKKYFEQIQWANNELIDEHRIKRCIIHFVSVFNSIFTRNLKLGKFKWSIAVHWHQTLKVFFRFSSLLKL